MLYMLTIIRALLYGYVPSICTVKFSITVSFFQLKNGRQNFTQANFTVGEITLVVITPTEEPDDGLSDAEIAGIVIGCVVALLLLIALLVLIIICW